MKYSGRHLDRSMHVGLLDAENNLPGNSDPVEQVVDKTHVVDESVDVAGAQHHHGGDQLKKKKSQKERRLSHCFPTQLGQIAASRLLRLTVNSKAGMGVQRLM